MNVGVAGDIPHACWCASTVFRARCCPLCAHAPPPQQQSWLSNAATHQISYIRHCESSLIFLEGLRSGLLLVEMCLMAPPLPARQFFRVARNLPDKKCTASQLLVHSYWLQMCTHKYFFWRVIILVLSTRVLCFDISK